MEADPVCSENLNKLSSACDDLGISLNEILEQKYIEVSLRNFIRCIPNDSLRDSRIPDFIKSVTGKTPSPQFIKSIIVKKREQRLDDQTISKLEYKQSFRCALCGELLKGGRSSHIDHIVPVSYGGESDASNYQILCSDCNIGKSNSVHWIMNAPFFNTNSNSLSKSLRYCVLSNANGTCSHKLCENTTKSSVLKVDLRIPWGDGGRFVFDNLYVLCEEHSKLRIDLLLHKTRSSLRFNNLSKYSAIKSF